MPARHQVSIGSDAVAVAEAYYAAGCVPSGSSSLETISRVYGAQAVVVSIDPRRVYVADPASVRHACVRAAKPGPQGEQWCWYQCTINGGRVGRDIGAAELARAVCLTSPLFPALHRLFALPRMRDT